MIERSRATIGMDGRTDPPFTTLIKGGEVADPASGYSGYLDVAIVGDTIAAVEADIDPGLAATVVDATGQIVTPGLVDLHTHVYWGVTYWGVEPDPIAARTGVTTWLDAGSAGAYSFPGFREYVVARSRGRPRPPQPFRHRSNRSHLGAEQSRLLRPRLGGDDRRRASRRHPWDQGEDRPGHDPRRGTPRHHFRGTYWSDR
jgi:hypothetical protein